jgi:hypothetical protein
MTSHLVRNELPLCGFTQLPSKDWPQGQTPAIGVHTDCKACIAALDEKGWADLAASHWSARGLKP